MKGINLQNELAELMNGKLEQRHLDFLRDQVFSDQSVCFTTENRLITNSAILFAIGLRIQHTKTIPRVKIHQGNISDFTILCQSTRAMYDYIVTDDGGLFDLAKYLQKAKLFFNGATICNSDTLMKKFCLGEKYRKKQ